MTAPSTTAAQLQAAQQGVALCDRSALVGRLRARGKDVLDLINRLSTNKVDTLQPGQGAPTVLTDDRGRIVDLLLLMHLGAHVLVLTSPQTREKVIQWLDRFTFGEDITVEDETEATAMLTVVGPGAEVLLGDVGLAVGDVPPFGCAMASLGGVEVALLRTDPLGLPGYDLVLPRATAPGARERLLAAGGGQVEVLDAPAWELLRVSRGVPAYGRELGEAYNPLEAGLIGAISFSKGCYVGQEVIARLDTYKKLQRRLVTLNFSPGAAVSQGDILEVDGKAVGLVTSVAALPQGQVVGLGYVRMGVLQPGLRLGVVGKGQAWAEVTGESHAFGPHPAG